WVLTLLGNPSGRLASAPSKLHLFLADPNVDLGADMSAEYLEECASAFCPPSGRRVLAIDALAQGDVVASDRTADRLQPAAPLGVGDDRPCGRLSRRDKGAREGNRAWQIGKHRRELPSVGVLSVELHAAGGVEAHIP